MKKCNVCEGSFYGEECPFGIADQHPWSEDYVLMKTGKLRSDEHQRNVARWVLHGASEHTEGVLNWAKSLMQKEKNLLKM